MPITFKPLKTNEFQNILLINRRKKKKNIYIYIYRERERERERVVVIGDDNGGDGWATNSGGWRLS